jgi:hypothetical protein
VAYGLCQRGAKCKEGDEEYFPTFWVDEQTCANLCGSGYFQKFHSDNDYCVCLTSCSALYPVAYFDGFGTGSVYAIRDAVCPPQDHSLDNNAAYNFCQSAYCKEIAPYFSSPYVYGAIKWEGEQSCANFCRSSGSFFMKLTLDTDRCVCVPSCSRLVVPEPFSSSGYDTYAVNGNVCPPPDNQVMCRGHSDCGVADFEVENYASPYYNTLYDPYLPGSENCAVACLANRNDTHFIQTQSYWGCWCFRECAPTESSKYTYGLEYRYTSVLDQTVDLCPGESYSPTFLPSSEPTTSIPTAIPTCAPTFLPTTQVPTATPSFTHTSKPSRLPTFVPTPIPTLAPTAVPSAKPTVTPTYTPTVNPTVLPSQIPTRIPSAFPTTVRPSELPTFPPTYHPSPNPTMIPSPDPTKIPTTTPTVVLTELPSHPTAIPTVTPTFTVTQPTVKPTTSAPTLSPTKETTMSFDAVFTMDGLDVTVIGEEEKGAIVMATAKSIGVDEQDVQFVSAEQISFRRRFLVHSSATDRANLQSLKAKIVTSVTQKVSDSSSATTTYQTLVQALKDSLMSGNFTHHLQVASVLLNAPATTSVTLAEVTYSEPNIIAPPTLQPTQTPADGSSSSSSALRAGAIIGIAIGGFVGAILIAGLIYLLYTASAEGSPHVAVKPSQLGTVVATNGEGETLQV